jgi:hypothetical protein
VLHITRIEAHFSDENGQKKDKMTNSVSWARLEGMKTIVVSNNGNTHDLAVKGAINKLKHP